MAENRNEDAGKPAAVVFLDLPDTHRAEALAKSLTAAVEGGALVLADSLDTLESAARNAPQARIVIVFTRPDIDIGLALANGNGARSALDDWARRAEALLGTVRRNRRRVVLIDDGTLATDPNRAKAVLGVRIGLPALDGPSPLLRLIGRALLEQDTATSALAGELNASSQSGEGEALSLQAAQDEFAALQTAIAREKRLTLELEQTKAQLNDRQEEQDSVLAELLALQEVLRTTRADLEHKAAQVLQLGQKLAQSDEAYCTSQAQIAAFYRSRSYRITAPFRWLRAALSGAQ